MGNVIVTAPTGPQCDRAAVRLFNELSNGEPQTEQMVRSLALLSFTLIPTSKAGCETLLETVSTVCLCCPIECR